MSLRKQKLIVRNENSICTGHGMAWSGELEALFSAFAFFVWFFLLRGIECEIFSIINSSTKRKAWSELRNCGFE
jgi:hypothetical protein